MALSSPREQNGLGPTNETPSELSNNLNPLIRTLEPFKQPARAATYQLHHRGRGCGGGSGRG